MTNVRHFFLDGKEFDLPYSFMEWIFDRYDGHRYDRCNQNAEYGISRDDFKNQYHEQMLEDARDYII